jgi:hypothetical protein
MKKKLLVVTCIGFLTAMGLMGCGGDQGTNPEAFGKNYISEKFKGAIVDLEDLKYTVIEDEEGSARVKIEGEIEYEETISLVKQGRKWVLASEAAAPKPEPELKPAPVEIAPEKKVQH